MPPRPSTTETGKRRSSPNGLPTGRTASRSGAEGNDGAGQVSIPTKECPAGRGARSRRRCGTSHRRRGGQGADLGTATRTSWHRGSSGRGAVARAGVRGHPAAWRPGPPPRLGSAAAAGLPTCATGYVAFHVFSGARDRRRFHRRNSISRSFGPTPIRPPFPNVSRGGVSDASRSASRVRPGRARANVRSPVAVGRYNGAADRSRVHRGAGRRFLPGL